MALDTTAGQVALGQLQSLPFENIIGGPLVAAIKAQALAADATADFIQAVGLQGPPGQLEAINVKFSYVDGTGDYRILTVPVLAILPIPFIVIDTVDIQFKARIAASAQQASEESRSSAVSVSGTASARWGGKRFGAAVTISGGYSAKKDSKASQESRYSVEYTMDVHVHASQAGMPQGMAQILNILQDAISNSPAAPPAALEVYGLKTVIKPTAGPLAFSEDFHVLVTDGANDLPTNYTITVTPAPSIAITVTAAPPPPANPAKFTLTPGSGLTATALPLPVTLTITATPPAASGKPTLTTVRTVEILAP